MTTAGLRERAPGSKPPIRRPRTLAWGLVVVIAGAAMSAPIIAAISATETGVAAGQVAAALPAEVLAVAGTRGSVDARELTRFYDDLGGRPAWLATDGSLGPWVRRTVAMLADAAGDGLVPADYDVDDLATRLAGFPGPSAADAAAFDVRLSAAVLRYYRHLHLGRVDPRSLGLPFGLPADTHRFSDQLRVAIDHGRVVETAQALAPPFRQYALLRDALMRYRQVAATSPDSPAFPATLRPGEVSAVLPPLHRLLVAVGDLPPDTPMPQGGVYDEPLVAGVRRFQARHGLEPDGIIGRATTAALAVPLTRRVRQIELALERLRWLPDLAGGRVIVVNIPMFRLWAWPHLPSTDPPALSMKVVVGRALNTQTPLFADQMEHVIFRPYWNVPTSILRNEMLPVITRDPAYLTRQNLEIVQGQGDNAPALAATADTIARLGRGDVRLRQRPGPRNALGLVKFMFPNDHNVYMHDTPSTALFAQSRRDFSHGCIRVEDPVGLAEWVLSDLPGWSREAVLAAMNGAPNRRFDLPEPIQVVIFYTTAIVEPDDGAVHFADDIYGHDARLDRVF